MIEDLLKNSLTPSEKELVLEISKQDNPTKTLLLQKLPWGITKLNGTVRSLKDKKILQAKQDSNSRTGKKNSGRRPDIFHFRPDLGYFLGLHIDVCYDEYVLLDFNGKVQYEKTYPVNVFMDSAIDRIMEQTRKFIEESQIPLASIAAMGVSSAVQFNKAGSSSFRSPSFAYDVMESLYPRLNRNYSFPVYYGRPQVLICYKEFRNDLIHEKKSFINIIISDNVGIAIFINGKNYLGHSGLSGDLGHLKIPGNPLTCYCGGTGCLRTIVSYNGICREAKRRLEKIEMKDGVSHLNPSIFDGPDYGKGVEMLVKKSVEHDTFAVKLIYDTATELGNAAATIVSLFNPEFFIISSVLNYAGEIFTDRIRSIIRTNCLGLYSKPLKIIFNDYVLSEIAEGSALFSQSSFLKELFHLGDKACIEENA